MHLPLLWAPMPDSLPDCATLVCRFGHADGELLARITP